MHILLAKQRIAWDTMSGYSTNEVDDGSRFLTKADRFRFQFVDRCLVLLLVPTLRNSQDTGNYNLKMITRVKTLNSKEYAWLYPASDDKILCVTEILTAIDCFRCLLARDYANSREYYK